MKEIYQLVSNHLFKILNKLIIVKFISVEVKNPCDPYPCQNNAPCVKLDDTRFHCDCSQIPFHGDICQYGKWSEPNRDKMPFLLLKVAGSFLYIVTFNTFMFLQSKIHVGQVRVQTVVTVPMWNRRMPTTLIHVSALRNTTLNMTACRVSRLNLGIVICKIRQDYFHKNARKNLFLETIPVMWSWLELKELNDCLQWEVPLWQYLSFP